METGEKSMQEGQREDNSVRWEEGFMKANDNDNVDDGDDDGDDEDDDNQANNEENDSEDKQNLKMILKAENLSMPRF